MSLSKPLTNRDCRRLDANNLSGNIPDCLGNLFYLQTLFVFALYFAIVPLEFDAECRWLNANNLEGWIPESFGDLVNLTEL